MKLLYPVPEPFPDNRARFIQIMNTCHALAEADVEVILLTDLKYGLTEKDILKYYGLTEIPNFRILRLPILRAEKGKSLRLSWHGVFHYALLLYILTKKNIFKEAVLYLRHLKLAQFLLNFRKILGVPYIFEVHEIFYKSTLSRRNHKLRDIELKVYNKVDKITCISQTLKDYLVSLNIPEEKIYVIPDGVRADWFNIVKKSGRYICYTGSLYRWKGVDILISSMRYLPDEHLLIVGGGERLNELKEFAKQEDVLERVKFTGFVPHSAIPEYLQQAKIVVLPNIMDGPSKFSSPLKLFEYMACGIPIVASDIPVFREVLVNGGNAILFEPGNPKALAKSIKILINDKELYKSLSLSAKKTAQNYTYNKRAERILNIIGSYPNQLITY